MIRLSDDVHDADEVFADVLGTMRDRFLIEPRLFAEPPPLGGPHGSELKPARNRRESSGHTESEQFNSTARWSHAGQDER